MVSITANYVDLHARRIYPATVTIVDGRIATIEAAPHADGYLLPGFIDAHVHIESSMMVPTEFARFAVRHGTVATVSDPHEIANVLGLTGVRFMIEQGRRTAFQFHWGGPSCVPATAFETAGAVLGPMQVQELFEVDGLNYLSEMMNYPGVLHDDYNVIAKLRIAKKLGKRIDGHAPGLRGDAMRRYAAAGISTDHECTQLDEALEKIEAGMMILIREGSAAKNFEALAPLLKTHPRYCMFCSDDLHPDALAIGHINRLVARAIADGADLFDVMQVACINPIQHYNLDCGQLRINERADFVLVNDLRSFDVRSTWIGGKCVYCDGESRLPKLDCPTPNHFNAVPIRTADIAMPARSDKVRVIVAHDGQLFTDEQIVAPRIDGGQIVADIDRDILKIVVVNRYQSAKPAVALIHGFRLIRGAIAGSVAHDSHNVIAVGTNDRDLTNAINAVIEHRGGLAVADSAHVQVRPLPVAGLMGTDGDAIAGGYAKLDEAAKELGSPLSAPFMTLSFMALLVIPKLKLSDRGLFDGERFQFVDVNV